MVASQSPKVGSLSRLDYEAVTRFELKRLWLRLLSQQPVLRRRLHESRVMSDHQHQRENNRLLVCIPYYSPIVVITSLAEIIPLTVNVRCSKWGKFLHLHLNYYT